MHIDEPELYLEVAPKMSAAFRISESIKGQAIEL